MNYLHMARKEASKSGLCCDLTKNIKVVIEISQGNLACKQIHEDKQNYWHEIDNVLNDIYIYL